LNFFETGGVRPPGQQQPFPAMGQAQPKLSIGLVMRGRGEPSALLDLVLEKIGRFEHCDSHDKSPAHRGFYQQTTRQVGICSTCKISTARKFAETENFSLKRNFFFSSNDEMNLVRLAGGTEFVISRCHGHSVLAARTARANRRFIAFPCGLSLYFVHQK
jgi:hypothetical protein